MLLLLVPILPATYCSIVALQVGKQLQAVLSAVHWNAALFWTALGPAFYFQSNFGDGVVSAIT